MADRTRLLKRPGGGPCSPLDVGRRIRLPYGGLPGQWAAVYGVMGSDGFVIRIHQFSGRVVLVEAALFWRADC